MKTKKIMIGLGSFVAVGVGVGAGVGIGYGVYHKSSTPHTQGLYNADGTNWIGVESGHIETSLQDGFVTINNASPGFVAKDLVIPDYVSFNGETNYPVKIIDTNAFYNQKNLRGTITFPSTLVKIGNGAFNGCSYLTGSLKIPSALRQIGTSDAFRDCNFTDIDVHNNKYYTLATNVGAAKVLLDCGTDGIFPYAASVNSIYSGLAFGALTIPNDVTFISPVAFNNCRFTDVQLQSTNPSYILANNVGSAHILLDLAINSNGSYDFSRNASAQVVGLLAFGNLTIPASVTTISSFEGCKFTGVTIQSGNPSYVLANNVGSAQIVLLSSTNGQFNYASDNSQIQGGLKLAFGNITIPNNIINIGDRTFMECSGLTGSLTIPTSVKTIGENAFRNCSGLTGSLTIPSSVETIGSYAFSGCSGFTGSLTIPDSVETIGSYAFSWCSGFTGSLTIPLWVKYISNGAFNWCSSFTGSLTIPTSVKTIGEDAFRNCSGLTGSLTIPSSVETIGGYAFAECSGMTGNLTIPSSVGAISNGAFNWCSGFTGSLTIPSNVNIIGSYAFNGCSGFTGSLTIPSSVETIGSYAFSGCSGFTGSLTIPLGVKYINDCAFNGCSSFTGSLTIPSSVETIGTDAFHGCSGFTGSLIIHYDTIRINSSAFYGCYNLSSLTLPNTITSIGSYAFAYCYRLKQLDFSQLSILRTIDYNAFYYCTSLTGSLTIPDSVETIGTNAFYGCSQITELDLSNFSGVVGDDAFSFMNALGRIDVAASPEFSLASGFHGIHDTAATIYFHTPGGDSDTDALDTFNAFKQGSSCTWIWVSDDDLSLLNLQ